MDLLYDNSLRFGAGQADHQVLIWDETLRDGEQAPGVAFHPDEKRRIAQALADAGVGVIDAGMPIVSEDEAAAIRSVIEMDLPCEVGVTVRCHETDLRAARECGARHVYMFLSVSRLHMQCKFGLSSYTDLQNLALRHIDYARTIGLEVTFIAEDSTGACPEDLCAFFHVLADHGVCRVIICDTAVRIPSPLAFYEYCRFILQHSPPQLVFGVHCHNDMGDANANTLLAILAGARIPTVTVNGIGERAGNAPLEQTVLALEKIGISTGIKLENLYELSRLVERFSGIPVSMHAPVIGLNAFRHESGIHAAGVLLDPRTYETILPEEVGRRRELIFGKHSGRHQVAALLEKHGIPHSPALIDQLLHEIKAMKEQQSHQPLDAMVESLQTYYRANFGIAEELILSRAKELVRDDRLYATAA